MHDATKHTATGDTHITSIVVHARPDAVGELTEAINNIPEAEVHVASATGKLVVSLETNTLHRVTDLIEELNRSPGVVNALLVYHQVEDAELLDDVIEINAPTGE